MTNYIMLSLSLILLALGFLFIERKDWLFRDLRITGAGYLMFFLLLMTASGFMVGAQSQAPLSIFTMNLVSNTVYYNSNSLNLYIYGASTQGLASFEGTNNIILSPTFNSFTQTLVVPPNTYYQFNFTGPGYFTGEYLNSS